MAILSPGEKGNHFNLTLSERQQAAQDLRSILADRTQKILGLLKAKQSSMMAHGALLSSDMAAHELYEGLRTILIGNELGDKYPISQFFAHFFSCVYGAADSAEKHGLIQKLVGQLKSEQGLIPLLCEFEVAFTYLAQGNEVLLIDLVGGNERTHDLIVRKAAAEINVEVKSIRFEKCIPAPVEAVIKALSILSNWADEHLRGPSIYEIKLNLKKVPRPSPQQIRDSVEELLRMIKPGAGRWATKIFRLSIKKINKKRRDSFTAEALLDAVINNIPPKEFRLVISSDFCNGYYLVSAGFDKLPSHAKLIKNAVSDACGQLPKDKPRVIHINFVKTGFLSPDNFSDFSKQYILQNTEITTRFRRAESEALIGIFFFV